VSLKGDVAIPAVACGLVIFAHGSGSSRLSPRNRLVADALHRKRLATLLFDLLTPEEAVAEADTGELRFNIRFLADRLATVTRWAKRYEALGSLGIGYFGASTGAAAALMAAAENPDIQAIVSRGGRTDLAGDRVTRVSAPTLCIVGSLDHPLIHWNKATLQRIPGIRHMVLVEGASHLFGEPGTLEHVAELAADWFELYLAPRHQPPA
jgi:putative phosphoribosyl transferase